MKQSVNSRMADRGLIKSGHCGGRFSIVSAGAAIVIVCWGLRMTQQFACAQPDELLLPVPSNDLHPQYYFQKEALDSLELTDTQREVFKGLQKLYLLRMGVQ